MVKNLTANAETQESRVNSWVGKITCRRAWQLTLVFFPEESHRQRSLVGYGPQGRTELDMNEASWHAHTHGYKSVREEHHGLFQSHQVIPLSFPFHLAKVFTDLFLFTVFRSVLKLKSSVTSYKN